MPSHLASARGSRLTTVVVVAGVLPPIATVVVHALLGPAQRVSEPIHGVLELVGACIAAAVAMLLLLRARHEDDAPQQRWVIAALVAMGIVDAAHAAAPFGVAWSWLRHGATLCGGVLFGCVWVPAPRVMRRHPNTTVAAIAIAAAAASAAVYLGEAALPQPWAPGGYALSVKVVNAAGGVGFLAAAAFFLRRYRDRGHSDDVLFAAHTLLFGMASLFFGFSTTWAADWWAWHVLRLAAYLVVIGAAYRTVTTLYERISVDAAELAAANAALEAENAQRRAAEVELEAHRRELEERVAERTEALREADRRKDQFMAVLSHELRNPLAPITSSLHVLAHAIPGCDRARRAEAVIRRQVGQLARLVDDLLDVTRVSRGKIRLDRERLDLAEVVRRTVEDHRAEFEARGVALELAVTGAPAPVDGDPGRLAQVVGNLLVNAAKFTGEGGRTTVEVSADGEAATLRVADTGVGMNPATIAGLFQPFVQADTSLDRSRSGLGLGLALVKGIVELHGGEVSAHSEGLGRGAQFVVRLPLAKAAEARRPAFRPAVSAPPRRILVVEDNVDAAEMLREVLELGGHAVTIAHDGLAGVARARELRPDVVLCDLGLPGIDGYEVARRLRADPALRRTFLVALSGYAQPEDLERSAQAGFDRHVPKPPVPEQLEALIASSASAPPEPAPSFH